MLLGLKSDISQAEICWRKKLAPLDCYEFFLRKTDSEDCIQKAVDEVKTFSKHVVLHQPVGFDRNNHKKLNLKLCKMCVRLAEKNDLHGVVIHPLKTMQDTTDLWNSLGSDKVMIENLTHDYFRTKKDMLSSPFPRLVFDVCHAYMVCKNNDYLIEWVKSLGKRVVWMHLADSDGETHGAPIGEGNVDWIKILELNKKGIIEVYDEDEISGEKKVDGYLKLLKMMKKV